ncbi:6-phosphogluconolactonase [Corynebacterium sp. 335C]
MAEFDLFGTPEFSRHADQAALVEAARARFCDVVAQAQGNDDVARVVITGGGAGIALLEALAADSGDVDWERVLVFYGDERFVPADDPERNQLQADRALLSKVRIPESHVFSILPSDGPFGDDPGGVARAYAAIVAEQAPDGFDLHLMGMGGEGHVNSLFPHSPALAEENALVAPVRDCPKPPPTRITLTMPAVRTADRIWLLVAGDAKADAVRAIADGADPAEWPASGVRGRRETVVFVDDAAAAKLD